MRHAREAKEVLSSRSTQNTKSPTKKSANVSEISKKSYEINGLMQKKKKL